MRIVPSIAELRAFRASLPHGQTVGFVPTMGYLHAGHLSLVEMARSQNEIVAVSIFVNPTQFGPNEDLSRYPRDMERDLALLREAGVDWVFTPSADEIYPPGYSTYIAVREVTSRLEGAARPGHFQGVATVVAKLFNIVQPHRAYFGQKDAQQVVVVRKMVCDLNFPVEIVVGETMREPDGHAMSSRNVYLNPEERQAALVLHKALSAARSLWEQGERRGTPLREAMQHMLVAEPLAHPDYVSVANPHTLEELDDSEQAREALASLAVRIGNTRLIDNFVMGGVKRKT
ncbi:MAG TPA: pantoate--beta-alanine ligase [Chloroflexia bacterium]|nr:pantoate--beta-alanine ligase [Chloroflexia bacterium]